MEKFTASGNEGATRRLHHQKLLFYNQGPISIHGSVVLKQ